MSSTYRDVDRAGDPDEARDWQDRIDAWPAIRAYKQRSYAALPAGGPVLDVGCGPGGDLVALGAGRAVGVDVSRVMCAAAATRAPMVVRAGAHHLPFADASFTGCRADRVLQHLDDHTAVLEELVRVVRPGGRVVVADPDQQSLVIHVPGVDRSLVDRVRRLRRDVGYRNGRYIIGLEDELRALGLDDITVDAFPLLLTDPDDAFGLPSWPRRWREQGVASFEEQELAAWDAGTRRARNGGFAYLLTYLVVGATKA